MRYGITISIPLSPSLSPPPSLRCFPLKIFTGLVVLRKLCNHPDLVTNDYRECVRYGREEGGSGVGEGGEDRDKEEDTALIRTRRPPKMRRRRSSGRSLDSEAEGGAREGQGGYYCEEKFGWGQRSGKMVVVEALLKMWREQRHRVLLFSQSKMVSMLLLSLALVFSRYNISYPPPATVADAEHFGSDAPGQGLLVCQDGRGYSN